MIPKKEKLQCSQKNDPDWVKEISLRFNADKKHKLTDNDKKFLQDLFLQYQRDGITPRKAFEKAKNVLMCFKNNKKRNMG